MVCPPSIAAAIVLRLCGISIFISQPLEPAPVLANWLCMPALLLLLGSRCQSSVPRLHICGELLSTIFVSELVTLLGRLNLEHLVQQASEILWLNNRCCSYPMVCILTLMPPALLLFILAPTQWREFVVQLVLQLPRPEADDCLLKYAWELPSYVYCQLKREDRLRAIRVFGLQAEQGTQREGRELKLES